MNELALPVLLTLTSVLGYVVGVRGLGLSRRDLARAAGRLCELAGLTVMFLGANLLVGVALVLTASTLSGRFISMYLLNDMTLVMLSALQGILFGCWWRMNARAS